MRRGGAHVTQAYFLPLRNILELDSYMIRLAAKGWIRRSPIGAGALSSTRGRREVCIVPIDERQCPNPKCGGRRRALRGGGWGEHQRTSLNLIFEVKVIPW